jgi:aminocarboxymuconate-semialdehyde decarboxylase
MDRYPRLTVCLAHGGGYVPYAIDRMDKGWQAHAGLRGQARALPSTYVNRFFYDSVTYTDRNLRFLIDVVGVERVVFGTDWPAPMVVDEPVQRLTTSVALTDTERHAILRGNLARLLSAPV